MSTQCLQLLYVSRPKIHHEVFGSGGSTYAFLGRKKFSSKFTVYFGVKPIKEKCMRKVEPGINRTGEGHLQVIFLLGQAMLCTFEEN